MKNRFLSALAFFALLFFPINAGAQDFGFGSWDEDDSSFAAPASSSPVKISGKVSADIRAFFDDMSSTEELKNIRLGDIFKGNLDFSVTGILADAFVNMELAPVFDGSSPIKLGEAYGRMYFGPLSVEAGLRKLSWGKADSFGPLDVINPLDYSDLSLLSDPRSIKIARPMIHATYNAGSFSRVEAVFVPWFQGHSFDMTGRWTPAQMKDMRADLENELTQTAGLVFQMSGGSMTLPQLYAIFNGIRTYLEGSIDSGSIYPGTDTLEYAQAGLRFTTTLGSSDLGFQYYFGRLPRPAGTASVDSTKLAQSIIADPSSPDMSSINVSMSYNNYHQIGVDFASVIAGLNVRAELGANITEDTDGTKADVYNPALVYSLGFDRELPLAITLNVQGNGSIKLFHDKTKDDPLDIEAGSKLTSTRITGIVSRKFLRDELELKVTGLWGIEDKDFLILPAIVWSRSDIKAELSAGFFGGDSKGELGQYKDNGFIRTVLSFSF